MSRITRPARLLSVAAALALLAGCSTAPAPEPSASAPTTRTVTTDQGDVKIPTDPQRIVVLNSNLAGYLFALDQKVSATIPEVPGPGGGDYPDTWAKDAEADKTVLLPWGEDGFDMEAILAADPDLIIGGGQGFPAFQAEKIYDKLGTIAPTVLVSKTLLSWQDQLSFIGEKIFDDAPAVAKLEKAYDDRAAEVASKITLPPLPAAYLVLTADGTPYALPEDSALPRTLADVGITPAPVVADNPGFEGFGTGDSFEVSPELLSTVFTAPTIFSFGFNGQPVKVADLATQPLYAQLPAFAAGSAFDLPSEAYRADYQRTMRLLDLIETTFSAR